MLCLLHCTAPRPHALAKLPSRRPSSAHSAPHLPAPPQPQVAGGVPSFALGTEFAINSAASFGLPASAHCRAPSVAIAATGGLAVAYTVVAPTLPPSLAVTTMVPSALPSSPQIIKAGLDIPVGNVAATFAAWNSQNTAQFDPVTGAIYITGEPLAGGDCV